MLGFILVMLIVIYNFTKLALLLWNISGTDTVFVCIHLYGIGDAQGRRRYEWLSLYIVCVPGGTVGQTR